jgi:hypothetical protein
LASDSQGNVYLAYVVGYSDMSEPDGDLYAVRRDAASGVWSASPELVSSGGLWQSSVAEPLLIRQQ